MTNTEYLQSLHVARLMEATGLDKRGVTLLVVTFTTARIERIREASSHA